MKFQPTKECLKYPPHLNPKTLPKPCRELTDDDIDLALRSIVTLRTDIILLPKTQYGRRVMVDHFMSLERKAIIADAGDFPRSYQPSQPR